MSGKHLSIDERIVIEKDLMLGKSLRQIGDLLRTAHTTIAREIVGRRVFTPGQEEKTLSDICARSASCPRFCAGCRAGCKSFLPRMACARLNRAPFVCDGCEKERKCPFGKMHYCAKEAEESYRNTLVSCRSGVNLTDEELEGIRECTSAALRKGQSPYHIVKANPEEITVSTRTLYRLLENGYLRGLGKLELKRAAGMKPRKGKRPQRRIQRACREGRGYEDFLAFMEASPDTPVVQMDTVEGTRGGRCLLTLHLPCSQLQLMFIRRRNCAASVAECLDELERRLGFELFSSIFQVILTDNGSEFTAPETLERSATREGRKRTRIFYCEPYSAWQKPDVESSNEYMRDVFPKGKAIPDITQEQVDEAASHINSKLRQSLGGKSAVAVFRDIHGDGALRRIGLREVPAREVNLTPGVLR